MAKIGNLGTLDTDVYEDFSISSMNNVNIGQYSAKGIKGTRNVIIGKNAGKIAFDVNNSIFIGNDAGSSVLTGNRNFIIGDEKSSLLELNSTINIGYNEIHKKQSLNIGFDVINSNDDISINNQFSLNNQISFKNYLLGNVINLGLENSLNSNINIGHHNSNVNISIGSSNSSLNSNAILIGNNLKNNDFSLNIDNFICRDDNSNLIYLGIGFFKDIPIIIGSKQVSIFQDLILKRGLTTNFIKINNKNDGNIYLKTKNSNNLIYYLPPLPEKYDNIFLTTDKEGYLEWIEVTDVLILTIITQGDTICNDLTSSNIYGRGGFLTFVNLDDKNTDEIQEGIRNIFFKSSLITSYFFELINSISTDVIKNINSTSNIYYDEKLYSSNFNRNLSFLTTDNIKYNEKRFYNSNDFNSNPRLIFNSLTTDDIKEGDKNVFFNEEGVNRSLENVINLIKEGSFNFFYTNERLFKNFNNFINFYNTNLIKQGSSNLFYNDSIASNTAFNTLNIISTDLIKEGSNLYSGDERILRFINDKKITTNDISISSNFVYFNSNSNIILDSDLIKQGSNRYLNNQDVLNTISFNTNTDFYKTGNLNIYGTEALVISDFSRITSNEYTTDNVNDNGNKNRFIKNNFYNNDIAINGFLKASNINDINLQDLREVVDVISIGEKTEVVHTYDVNTFNIQTQLSNMEISFTNDNNDEVPFIVINNRVGIHNLNPKYELDVNGVLNCCNLLFNENNFSNIMNSVVKYDLKSNVGIGTNNPAEKLQVIGNILASGTIISSFSDIRLKDVIEPLNNPLEIIGKLNGFKYKTSELGKSFGFEDKIEIGLNAQEVLNVIPEIVSIAPFDSYKEDDAIKSKSGENYLSLRYERIIPYLIEAIKELKKENEEIKKIIYN